MKRTASSSRKSSKSRIAQRDDEYTMRQAGSTAAFDDRVSEEIFDVEDERAEVDIIVQGMMHDAS